MMAEDLMQWLLDPAEPWTRHRTLVDLLGRSADDPIVQSARAEMLAHPQVRELIAAAGEWPGYPLKRHNDAKHPLHTLTVLADFGLTAGDPGMAVVADKILARQADDGVLQILTNIHPRYGGSGKDQLHWSLCDAPVTLHALLAFGLGDDGRVRRAVDHLVGTISENGWCCVTASGFRGPGRKADPCPVANVYALKALSLVPELVDSPAVQTGAEMLLGHWERQSERKIYLFGIGTDFRKLKYPFVWYDILHVVEVLGRFPVLHADPRFQEMVATITAQADEGGRYTASSMYRAWKGWSFADKKNPSPWLTFLALRSTRCKTHL
jgi:hypothetical protein